MQVVIPCAAMAASDWMDCSTEREPSSTPGMRWLWKSTIFDIKGA
jgi:hypothetical protein